MKKYIDGKYIEMTPEEIAQMQAEQRKAELAEYHRPFSAEEVASMLLTAQINMLNVDDHTALRMKSFYPAFESVVGQTVKKGFKFTYAGKLWAVAQTEMCIQSHYCPGDGMESLYTEVCEIHTGTMEDPIPYAGNMVLERGKYYFQGSMAYLCIRDTDGPVHHPLAELTGLYVECI